MTRRDWTISVDDMRIYARHAVTFATGKTRADLDDEPQFQFAIIRAIEVIGEAAAQVPPDVRERFPAIPWPTVVGMRNRLIHGYSTVNLNVVWRIVRNELVPLIAQLDVILAALGPEDPVAPG